MDCLGLLIGALCLVVSTVSFASLTLRYRAQAKRLESRLAAAEYDLGVVRLHKQAVAKDRDAFAETYVDLKNRAYLRDPRGRMRRAADVLDA